jgi:hypothetical protein
VFGQSGTAMPAPYEVTMPPIKISGKVPQAKSQAARCGQRLSDEG